MCVCGHTHTHTHWPNEESVRQWSERPGFNPMSSHTKDQMVLDAALLSTIR